MNNRNDVFEQLKTEYGQSPVPDQLDLLVSKAIMRAKEERALLSGIEADEESTKEEKKVSSNHVNRKILALVATVAVIFTASVNFSPTFAEQFKEIPILGELVKVLQFTNGQSSGGEVTDGSNVSSVSLEKAGGVEEVTIRFEQNGSSQSLAGAYDVNYMEKPYSMLFSLHGVRLFSAVEDFENLKKSQYIEAVYPVVTLDDSSVRFMVVFKEAVGFSVKEVKEPASLLLTLSAGVETEASKALNYAIVTTEMPQGEGMAMLEEIFASDFEAMRILPVKGKMELYYMEMGQYGTKEEAEAKLNSVLPAAKDQGIELKVIKR